MRSILISTLLILLLISCAKAATNLEATQEPNIPNELEDIELVSEPETVTSTETEQETTQEVIDNSNSESRDDGTSSGDENQNIQGITEPQDVWCSALWGIYQEYFSVDYTPKLDHNDDGSVGAIDFTIFARYYRTKELVESQEWCHKQIMK